MKNLKTIVVVLIVLGALAMAYAWFFVYNKSHRDYESAKADYKIEAVDCYTAYANLSPEAQKYTGKILEIHGPVTSVEEVDSLTIVVFVFNEGLFGGEGIRCTLLSDYQDKARQINLNDELTLKGFCSGYNDTDVIFEHCSILNP